MKLRIADGVAAFVQERGGRLYVRTSTHHCCTGPFTLLETSTRRPSGRAGRFRSMDAGGFELLIDFGRRREPEELVLELGGVRRTVRAYWDDRAFAD